MKKKLYCGDCDDATLSFPAAAFLLQGLSLRYKLLLLPARVCNDLLALANELLQVFSLVWSGRFKLRLKAVDVFLLRIDIALLPVDHAIRVLDRFRV